MAAMNEMRHNDACFLLLRERFPAMYCTDKPAALMRAMFLRNVILLFIVKVLDSFRQIA